MINTYKVIANVIHNKGRCALGTDPEGTEENLFCNNKCPLQKEALSCGWDSAYSRALEYVNKAQGEKRKELLKVLL